jgi:hypothetical protein
MQPVLASGDRDLRCNRPGAHFDVDCGCAFLRTIATFGAMPGAHFDVDCALRLPATDRDLRRNRPVPTSTLTRTGVHANDLALLDRSPCGRVAVIEFIFRS